MAEAAKQSAQRIDRNQHCSELDTSLLPVAERFHVWRDSISPLFEAIALDKAHGAKSEAFEARAKLYLVDKLTFGYAAFSAEKYRRNYSWRATHDQDNFLLQLYVTGGYSGFNGRNNITVRSGDISLLDLGKDLGTQAADSTTINLSIPRSIVREYLDISELRGGVVFPRESELTRVLGWQMLALWKQVDVLSEAQTQLMLEGLLTMARSTLLSLDSGSGNIVACTQMSAAQLDIMCDFINRNLALPQLDSALLCQQFHLSRASLYRLFKPLGGVSRYINTQRLERCYHELSSGIPGQLPIAVVAGRYGFASYPHFSRAFKTHFGVSPREVASGHAGRTAASGALSSGGGRLPHYQGWLSLR